MPNRKVHNKVCELFGIDYRIANRINRDIDLPSKFLGKKHRILFHDYDLTTMLLLAKYKFKPEAVLTWYLHKLTDEMAKDKKMRTFFKLLELL